MKSADPKIEEDSTGATSIRDATVDADANGSCGGGETTNTAKSNTNATRQRILDTALEIFTELGYNKSSMRELAKRLGVTAAALYYHFDSKEAILSGLVANYFASPSPVDELREVDNVDLAAWTNTVDRLIDHLLSQRKLFRMVERNQAAIEQVARIKNAVEPHQRREKLVQQIFANQELPIIDRVRIACSLGAIIGLVMHGGDSFDDLSEVELRSQVKIAIHDLLKGNDSPKS